MTRTVPPALDAHHALGEYHAWAALDGANRVAQAAAVAELPDADARAHAARLAAALGEVLAELAGLRRLLAGLALPCPVCSHAEPIGGCRCAGPREAPAPPCPCESARMMRRAAAEARALGAGRPRLSPVR